MLSAAYPVNMSVAARREQFVDLLEQALDPYAYRSADHADLIHRANPSGLPWTSDGGNRVARVAADGDGTGGVKSAATALAATSGSGQSRQVKKGINHRPVVDPEVAKWRQGVALNEALLTETHIHPYDVSPLVRAIHPRPAHPRISNRSRSALAATDRRSAHRQARDEPAAGTSADWLVGGGGGVGGGSGVAARQGIDHQLRRRLFLGGHRDARDVVRTSMRADALGVDHRKPDAGTEATDWGMVRRPCFCVAPAREM